jgi:glycosyltransferase involved in cell wall biosynthesis
VLDELEHDVAPCERSVVRVYDPFDADAFTGNASRKSRSAVRAEFGIPDSATVIALAGRVCADKRQDLLIAAAMIGNPDLFYLIVGGDPPTSVGQKTFRELLVQSVTDFGLAGRVFFTGMRNDVADLMVASDVIVLASEDEAFGRALLEGLSLGKHIVGPNAGGPAEIIGANERGTTFTPGDPFSLAQAISETLTNEGCALARTRAGAHWIRKVCSPKYHAAEMMRLYDRMGSSGAA